jgi:hypothetical protein
VGVLAYIQYAARLRSGARPVDFKLRHYPLRSRWTGGLLLKQSGTEQIDRRGWALLRVASPVCSAALGSELPTSTDPGTASSASGSRRDPGIQGSPPEISAGSCVSCTTGHPVRCLCTFLYSPCR